MTRLDISLPDDVKALADQRASDGGYSSLSEYLADLIRRDRDQQQRTEQLLLRRLESGPSREMTEADFDQIRTRLNSEIKNRHRP
jgi:antitoxin ParD1/3/4